MQGGSCSENNVAFVCKGNSKPTLGESATGVKRQVMTHDV